MRRGHKPAAPAWPPLPLALPYQAGRGRILHQGSPSEKQLPCPHFQCFLFAFILCLLFDKSEDKGRRGRGGTRGPWGARLWHPPSCGMPGESQTMGANREGGRDVPPPSPLFGATRAILSPQDCWQCPQHLLTHSSLSPRGNHCLLSPASAAPWGPQKVLLPFAPLRAHMQHSTRCRNNPEQTSKTSCRLPLGGWCSPATPILAQMQGSNQHKPKCGLRSPNAGLTPAQPKRGVKPIAAQGRALLHSHPKHPSPSNPSPPPQTQPCPAVTQTRPPTPWPGGHPSHLAPPWGQQLLTGPGAGGPGGHPVPQHRGGFVAGRFLL